MRLIYIAGPFRAPNAWEIKRHIDKAEALALDVWRLGAACLCPHLNTQHFDGVLPDRLWLDGDLEMLKRCDAVLMLDGWLQSSGARREHDAALSHQLPVFFSLAALKYWLDASQPKSWQEIKAAGLLTAPHVHSASPSAPAQIVGINHNDGKGHGHVTPRPDGVKARCGGPGLCRVCQRERKDNDIAVQLHFDANRIAEAWPPTWMDTRS